MKQWLPVILLVSFVACKSSNDKPAAELTRDEMPAAVRELYKASAMYPDSAGLRMQLVDALDSLGAVPQALAEMDSLIHTDSLNYGFWYRKSMLQQNSRDTAGALRSLRNAIRIYPAPDAMLAAANLFAEKKDTTALYITRQIDRMRLGREFEAHTAFIEGVYYARKGDKTKALNRFDACIRADFNYMEAYMEKGFIFYDSRQFAEAETVFATTIRIRNNYADGFYWLAKCQETRQDKTDAIENYRHALQLDPGISEAREALKRLGAA